MAKESKSNGAVAGVTVAQLAPPEAVRGDAELDSLLQAADMAAISKYMSDRNMDVNFQDERNQDSVLQAACGLDKVEVVKALHKNGADIMLENKRGEASLHTAIKAGAVNCIKFLISCGADVDSLDKSEKSALDYADARVIKAIKEFEKSQIDEHGLMHFKKLHEDRKRAATKYHGTVLEKKGWQSIRAHDIERARVYFDLAAMFDAHAGASKKLLYPFEAKMVGWKDYEDKVRTVSVRLDGAGIHITHTKVKLLRKRSKTKSFPWDDDMQIAVKDGNITLDVYGTHTCVVTVERAPKALYRLLCVLSGKPMTGLTQSLSQDIQLTEPMIPQTHVGDSESDWSSEEEKDKE